jgi:predicted transcriptional regulator
MKKDPGQMKNVYGLPAYEQARKKLKQELENWQKQMGDTVLNEMIRTFKNFP